MATLHGPLRSKWQTDIAWWWINFTWSVIASDHGAPAHWWYDGHKAHGFIMCPPYPIVPPSRPVQIISLKA